MVLKMIKRWYSRQVAAYYDRFMRKIEVYKLGKLRKQLLTPLHGNILEIGAGTGVNFAYYQKGAKVFAIEPDVYMANLAFAKLETQQFSADISLETIPIEQLEINSPSFDAVVCTLVLCTIPDPIATLEKIKNILKPNGQLVVLEHIQSKSKWKAKFYDLATPIWKHCGQGCHLNRPTDEYLLRLGFKPLYEEYFQLSIPFYVGKLTK